jgi:pyruvate dehydrogenase kinase 2/3/4
MVLFKISEQLAKKIHYFASFPQTGVSIRQMVEFGRNPSSATILRATLFLEHELPIRLAHRVAELEKLPHNLSEMSSVVRVKNWYAESFQELIEFPKIELPPDLKVKTNEMLKYHAPCDTSSISVDAENHIQDFVSLIERIKRRHDPVVATIANGILEFKYKNGFDRIDSEIQSFLDRFFLSRIGIRMLIGQHVALQKPSPQNYVGILCTKTNISEIAQDAIDNARYICEDYYGLFKAPEIRLHCPENLEFTYVPSHLHHILFELLKNSLRATVELHGVDCETFPIIKIIVARGNEDITIKISDEGGGIPRSGIDKVWTYMYTTAKSQPLDPNFSQSDFKAPMAGFGYGLPLSRLYAQYFGGNLTLNSMEGYGTDAYIHLARLGDSEEPLP